MLRIAFGRASAFYAIGLAMAWPARAATCNWNDPGLNPHTGSLAAAVDRYQHIPKATRAKLKRRVEAWQPDEIVTITKWAVLGSAVYDGELKNMHWGAGSVCPGVVDRSKWMPGQYEHAPVYCEDGHCVAVPLICRNVVEVVQIAQRAVHPVSRELEGHGTSAVPEPSQYALTLCALMACAAMSRKGAIT